jgi:hypothetical protein
MAKNKQCTVPKKEVHATKLEACKPHSKRTACVSASSIEHLCLLRFSYEFEWNNRWSLAQEKEGGARPLYAGASFKNSSSVNPPCRMDIEEPGSPNIGYILQSVVDCGLRSTCQPGAPTQSPSSFINILERAPWSWRSRPNILHCSGTPPRESHHTSLVLFLGGHMKSNAECFTTKIMGLHIFSPTSSRPWSFQMCWIVKRRRLGNSIKVLGRIVTFTETCSHSCWGLSMKECVFETIQNFLPTSWIRNSIT